MFCDNDDVTVLTLTYIFLRWSGLKWLNFSLVETTEKQIMSLGCHKQWTICRNIWNWNANVDQSELSISKSSAIKSHKFNFKVNLPIVTLTNKNTGSANE